MTINERIKTLRKNLGKNQKDFGAAIGVTQAGISYIEQAGSNVSGSTIKSICKTFNVSETWLRSGEGEPFQQDKQSVIERMAEEYQLTDLERSIFTSYLELNTEARTAIMGYITNLVDTLEVAKAKTKPVEPVGNTDKLATSGPASTDLAARLDALERETERVRRENAELRQKIQAMEEEDAQRDIISSLCTPWSESSSSWTKTNKGPPGK